MTSADIKAIRARAEAATPGPWDYDATALSLGLCITTRPHGQGQIVASADARDPYGRVNASFIAAARIDVPALCDEVERLRAALNEITEFYPDGNAGLLILVARAALEKP